MIRHAAIFGRIAAWFGLTILMSACGKNTVAPDIAVTDVWSRPATTTGVVYLQIRNRGGADRLLRAESDIAEFTEIHESYVEDDRMKMRHLADGVLIPAYETVLFKPAGLHIMLINLKKELNTGDSFEATLHFEKAGMIRITSQVAPDRP